MTLKAVIDTIDAVPEALREHYTERDGKFHLAAEGFVSRDKLDEFRNNNIALNQQLADLGKRYDGIDPDRARELLLRAEREKERKLIDAGKVEELLAERTGAMKGAYEKQIADLASEKDKTSKQLAGLVVDGALRDAATKAGIRPTAIDDVLLRGQRVFRMHEGKAVAFDGDKPLYGKDGEPMPIAEWVNGLTVQAPHLFEASSGSGAKGGASTGNIRVTDEAAFLNNLDKIASGDVKVSF